MPELDVVKQDIELLRSWLMRLIQIKDNLLDEEVLRASKLLDDALNDYNNVIFKGLKCK